MEGGGGGSSSRRRHWVEVVVEVVRAENLMPKDGEGSASAFVEVVLDGQRKKTEVRARDLNPVWNQQLLFHVPLLLPHYSSLVLTDIVDEFQLDINVYSANNAGKTLRTPAADSSLGRRSSTSISFLGRVRIPGSAAFVSEAQASVLAYPLRKRSFFSHVRGRLYLRVFCRSTSHCPPTNLALQIPPSASTSSSPPEAVTAAATSLQNSKQLPCHELDQTSSDLNTISTSASSVDGDSDSRSSFSTCRRPETLHALTSQQLLHSPPQSANYRAQPSVMSSTPFSKEVMNLSHPSQYAAGTCRPAISTMSSRASTNYGPPAAASGPGCVYSRSYTAPPAGNNSYDCKPKETRPRLAATANRNLPTSSGIGMHMLLQQQQQNNNSGGGSSTSEFAAAFDAGGMSLVAGSNYDLVERMEYLYVKVVRAKSLRPKDIAMASASSGAVDAYVLLKIGNVIATTRVVERSVNPEWNEVFAFSKDKFQAPLLELMVKDRHPDHTSIVPTTFADVVGYIAFDLAEVPVRVPPDSALAPQWYKLEKRKPAGRKSADSLNQYSGYFQSSDLGEIMVSVWRGTQADEAFSEASWHSDAGGIANQALARSKVYMSPRLWYLRVQIIEAQDLLLLARMVPNSSADGSSSAEQTGPSCRVPEIRVRVQLGFQVAITRAAVSSGTNWSNPSWNEDLLFVAAEPFEDPLILTVEDRVASGKDQVVGRTLISIASVERRTDRRHVNPRWYNLLEKAGGQPAAPGAPLRPANASGKPQDYAGISSRSSRAAAFMSRVHVRMCLEGGYHVLDESTQFSSDMRPSSKSLWPAPIGVLELGILGATGLLPTKSRDRVRGTTDAYVVAKYGPKWVRSRTVVDSFSPSWNEQYTWEVYDPCTVLTVAVFDNASCSSSADLAHHQNNKQQPPTKSNKHHPADIKLGKVRIRLSTLDSGRVYAHSYPLLLLQTSGVKKMGELELSVRFSAVSAVSLLSCYGRPLLPKMHYVRPLSVTQVDALRKHAVRIIAARLARAEPPVKPEVVHCMLDAGGGESNGGGSGSSWSMRRSKANWVRIAGLMSGAVMAAMWMREVRDWRNPMTTLLVHLLILMLVCFPDLILPTLFLYLFLVGAWHYRWRPRQPLHVDLGLSQLLRSNGSAAAAAAKVVVEADELEEEMDSVPTECKAHDVVRARYDRLRTVAARVQGVLGDVATQGERVRALLSWRDPRATALFLLFCLLASLVLYLLPFRPFALALSFFLLRHPRLRRANVPSLPINFFRRLPALSDLIL